MDAQSLLRSLAGLPISQIAYFPTVGSSNDVALEWLEGDVADGALVVADEQTVGRGRLTRRWVTQPGAALAFSLALRPTRVETAHLGLFPALGALAVCEALEVSSGLTVCIKWPNDVLIGGRKLCGILPEAVWDGSELRGLCLGIGLNVREAAVPPAESLLFPATSVEAALGSTPERESLLRAILAALFDWRARIDTPAFVDAINARMAYRNAPVQIEQAGGAPLTGVALGFAPDGSLRLQTSNEETLVSAGDVRLRPVDGPTSQPGGREC